MQDDDVIHYFAKNIELVPPGSRGKKRHRLVLTARMWGLMCCPCAIAPRMRISMLPITACLPTGPTGTWKKIA
jgi:hypothetical protein